MTSTTILIILKIKIIKIENKTSLKLDKKKYRWKLNIVIDARVIKIIRHL